MMVQESVVEIGGHRLLLRPAGEEDAERVLAYRRKTAAETRFLSRGAEEITQTPQQERAEIRRVLASPTDILLMGFWDGAHVDNCTLTGMEQLRFRHRATLGIALYQAYTGLGIGGVMIGTICDIARAHGIEQVELEVSADNPRAIALYARLGFEACGRFPNNVKYADGSYADALWMVKRL